MILPDKPGAVIRWKYKYDGAYQYQVTVLSIHPDYEQGMVWHRSGSGYTVSQTAMQVLVEGEWGEWEILHPGEAE